MDYPIYLYVLLYIDESWLTTTAYQYLTNLTAPCINNSFAAVAAVVVYIGIYEHCTISDRPRNSQQYNIIICNIIVIKFILR